MINPDIYAFLKDLKRNNNRDWFQNNKERYDRCRQSFVHFTELAINVTSVIDSSVGGLLPKDCIFRINRDIRFSKDKSPYKTNFGCFIVPGGRNSGFAGYYIHLEPDNSFLAGGIYMPSSQNLKAIRQEIYYNYDEFEEIVGQKDFLNHFEGLTGEKLKTKPKGYPDDFQGMDYLRLKQFTVIKSKTDNEMLNKGFIDEMNSVFKALSPLNKFLNAAVAEA